MARPKNNRCRWRRAKNSLTTNPAAAKPTKTISSSPIKTLVIVENDIVWLLLSLFEALATPISLDGAVLNRKHAQVIPIHYLYYHIFDLASKGFIHMLRGGNVSLFVKKAGLRPSGGRNYRPPVVFRWNICRSDESLKLPLHLRGSQPLENHQRPNRCREEMVEKMPRNKKAA
jgi:hypothetical protein